MLPTLHRCRRKASRSNRRAGTAVLGAGDAGCADHGLLAQVFEAVRGRDVEAQEAINWV
jgi:hypothetical protein